MAESNNVGKLQKSSCSLGDLSKEDLLRKLKDFREANTELLEDERQLLLRSQKALKAERQLERAQNEEVIDLRRRLNFLERSYTTKCIDSSTQTTEELVCQISRNSMHDSDATSLCYRRRGAGLTDLEEQNVSGRCFADLKSISKPALKKDECRCGAFGKLAEVVRINHLWQKDYNSLLEDHNRIAAQLNKLENLLHIAESDQIGMVRKLVGFHDGFRPLCDSITTSSQFVEHNLAKDTFEPSADDIEALKYQLVVCKEDFELERQEKQKLFADVGQLKLELEKSFAVIDDLCSEMNAVKENLRRVTLEKQHIISELQRLSSNTSSFSYSPLGRNEPKTQGAEPERSRSEDTIPRALDAASESDRWSMGTPSEVFHGGAVVRDGVVGEPYPRYRLRRNPGDLACDVDMIAHNSAKSRSPVQGR